MTETPNNQTRLHMLDVAEKLFSERGYNAVKLRDIAAGVGIHHASLYYYAPGGKKQLFVEVMERNFERHRLGLTDAIAGAGDNLTLQLQAVAHWLVSQPPLDFSRMQQGDMPEISPDEAQRLMQIGYDALRIPIAESLEKASKRGLIEDQDFDVAALALVSLVQSVHAIPAPAPLAYRQRLGQHLVDMMLNGLLKH